ncbi:hypothetical protein ACIRL3_15540 [Streptomyces sp. NPDC102384]|uniref:effector-associated constant component EACC1 n=1 Tax=Streptomyces sp. NPDC102384 TaxID=3366166 RepID=UPI0038257456
MQLDVCVDGPQQEDDLRSLHDWLRREPAVRKTARLGLRDAPAASGTMGSTLDVLELVTGNGWSAAAFIMSVVTWRSTRPRRPRVTVRRGDVEITVLEGTDEEVARLVRQLEQAHQQEEQRPS